MNVTVCIGSSCHLNESYEIMKGLQRLIAEHGLKDSIALSGTFCMERCQHGICVTIDGEPLTVTPQTVNEFFDREILQKYRPDA